MKKIISFFVAFLLVFSLVYEIPCQARNDEWMAGNYEGLISTQISFSDIANVKWAADAISRLAEQGILNGMGDGKFAPTNNVTRGQFACIVVRAFGSQLTVGTSQATEFSDVKSGAYYYHDVLTARAAGASI